MGPRPVPKTISSEGRSIEGVPETSRVQNAVLLILDDEPDIAISLQQFIELRLPNVDVVATTSPKEAREYIHSNRVDAVVVDYRLPDQDGVTFLEELRRAKPDIPGVLITAYGHPTVLADAVNRGKIQGLFLKPLDVENLVAAVGQLLRKRMGTTGRIPLRPTFGQDESRR